MKTTTMIITDSIMNAANGAMPSFRTRSQARDFARHISGIGKPNGVTVKTPTKSGDKWIVGFKHNGGTLTLSH